MPQGIVKRGLVGWYKFNEGSGIILYDSKSGYNGANTGATPGATGYAFTTDDYVGFGLPALDGITLLAEATNQYTVMEAVSNWTVGHGITRGLNTTTAQFALYVTANVLYCRIRGASTNLGAIDTGSYLHTITWNGTSAAYQRNIAAPVAVNLGVAADDATQNIGIGALANGALGFMEGTMHYGLLYNVALTSVEKAKNYTIIKKELAKRGVII